RVRPFCLKVRCHPGLAQPGRLNWQRAPSRKGPTWASLRRASSRPLVCRFGRVELGFTINKVTYLFIRGTKKWFPKKQIFSSKEENPLTSGFQPESGKKCPPLQLEKGVIRNRREQREHLNFWRVKIRGT